MNESSNEPVVVWLTEYRRHGYLIKEGPHTAIIEFVDDGETVMEHVENDEWEFREEQAIEHEFD